MRLSATIALPVSVSTRPRCRTGHSTMPTKVMKAKSSPTVIVPAARNAPPAISTMVICAMQKMIADAPVQPHQPIHAEIVVAERGVALAKALDLELLPSESPHHANAGEVLLQHRRHGRFGLVHLEEDPLHPREERHRAQDDERHQAHRQHRQPLIAPEQHRRHDRQQQHGATNLHHLRRQEHAHGLHIRAAALHEVAGVRRVEERRRQDGAGVRTRRRATCGQWPPKPSPPSDRGDKERALRAR